MSKKNKKGLGGYADPPKSGQFQPGKSGNPKGRPKGSKNLKTLIMNEAHELVEIVEKGEKKVMSQLHVMVAQLRNKAMGSDLKAIDRFLDYVSRYEEQEETSENNASTDIKAEDADILRAYEEQLRKGGKGDSNPEKKDNNND